MAGNKLKLAVVRWQEEKSVAGNWWLVAGEEKNGKVGRRQWAVGSWRLADKKCEARGTRWKLQMWLRQGLKVGKSGRTHGTAEG